MKTFSLHCRHVGFWSNHRNRPCLRQHSRSAKQVKACVDWRKFYESELGPLKGHGPWHDVLCCFHRDTHPSLRVNIEHGGYWCPVCGVKGDALDFLQKRNGASFADALRVLEGFT